MLATGDIIGEGVGVGPCVIATLVLKTADDGSIGINTDQMKVSIHFFLAIQISRYLATPVGTASYMIY